MVVLPNSHVGNVTIVSGIIRRTPSVAEDAVLIKSNIRGRLSRIQQLTRKSGKQKHSARNSMSLSNSPRERARAKGWLSQEVAVKVGVKAKTAAAVAKGGGKTDLPMRSLILLPNRLTTKQKTAQRLMTTNRRTRTRKLFRVMRYTCHLKGWTLTTVTYIKCSARCSQFSVNRTLAFAPSVKRLTQHSVCVVKNLTLRTGRRTWREEETRHCGR